MAQEKWQQEASYRGVPFFVEATEDEFARRGAHHQFPQRDKGVWEDLGKDDTVYTITGYVTELSPGGYKEARDKLIEACTAGGIGDFIHPYYGTKKVQCTSCRVSHDDHKNGMANFSLSFIEADEPAPRAGADNSAAKVNDAADAAQDATVDAFADGWNLGDVPGYVYDAAKDLVQDVADNLKELAGPLPGILEDTSKFVDGAARLLGVVSEALDDPMTFFLRQADALTGGLLGKGLALGQSIAGLGRMLSLFSGTEKQAYQTQQNFMAMGTLGSATGKEWPAVPMANQRTQAQAAGTPASATVSKKAAVPVTPNRAMQAKNQEVLRAVVERTAVIEACRMTPYMPLESRTEAVTVRDTLTEHLDRLAESAPARLYKRLEELRAAVVADLTRRGPELSRVGSYTPKVTRPALVLAYELYRDIGLDGSRATELAARNHIAHPGFMPGGQTLEVMLNA